MGFRLFFLMDFSWTSRYFRYNSLYNPLGNGRNCRKEEKGEELPGIIGKVRKSEKLPVSPKESLEYGRDLLVFQLKAGRNQAEIWQSSGILGSERRETGGQEAGGLVWQGLARAPT